MPNDYFTLEEAQSVLPRVRELLGETRELKRRADTKIIYWKQKGTQDPAELAIARGHVEYLLSEARKRLESLTALGCLVKDIDKGLVDFPGWILGQGDVYLCWQWGEERVSHWHRQSEGFANRQSVSPALFSLRKYS